MQLAEYVEGGMSLRRAALEMGMAYSKAWRIMTDFEAATGFPLVVGRRGGSGGGGSELTPDGKALLDGYRTFLEKTNRQCDRLFQEFQARVKPRRSSRKRKDG